MSVQGLGDERRHFPRRVQGALARRFARGWSLSHLAGVSPGFVRIHRTVAAWIEASGRCRGGPYAGRATLALSAPPLPREKRIMAQHPDVGWSRLVDPARLSVHTMPSNRLDMIAGRHAIDLAVYSEERIE